MRYKTLILNFGVDCLYQPTTKINFQKYKKLSSINLSPPSSGRAVAAWRSPHRLGPPSIVPPQAALKDLTCCTCRHRGRWSHAVEEGEVMSWRKEEPRCPVTKEEGHQLARHRASCCRLSLRKKGGAKLRLHGWEIERESC
jgi:hypothetical protein